MMTYSVDGSVSSGSMSAEKISLILSKNDPTSQKYTVSVDKLYTMRQTMKVIRRTLGYSRTQPIKLFYLNGEEITSMNQIKSNEVVYCVQGEPFFNISKEMFHIAILGGVGVGKTQIALRFIRDTFNSNWVSTIEDSYKKSIYVDKMTSVLEIVDTGGQDNFRDLRAEWMINKDGLIFVYDVADVDSVKSIYAYVDLLEKVCKDSALAPPIIIVGNKADIYSNEEYRSRRLAVRKEIADLIEHCQVILSNITERYDFKYFESLEKAHAAIPSYRKIRLIETSAFTGDGVVEMFNTLVREMRLQKQYQNEVRRLHELAGGGCIIT